MEFKSFEHVINGDKISGVALMAAHNFTKGVLIEYHKGNLKSKVKFIINMTDIKKCNDILPTESDLIEKAIHQFKEEQWGKRFQSNPEDISTVYLSI